MFENPERASWYFYGAALLTLLGMFLLANMTGGPAGATLFNKVIFGTLALFGIIFAGLGMSLAGGENINNLRELIQASAIGLFFILIYLVYEFVKKMLA